MRRNSVLAFIASLSIVFTACQNTPADSEDKIAKALDDMNLSVEGSKAEILVYRINGWRYVDKYNVILTLGNRDNYLVGLRHPCPGLNGAFKIGFTSTGNKVTKFDDIVVSNRGPGAMDERCGIKDIVLLKPRE